MYQAQLAALLEAPTKFVLLNPPVTSTTSSSMFGTNSPYASLELSISERGSEWIPDDLEYFMDRFNQIEPSGVLIIFVGSMCRQNI